MRKLLVFLLILLGYSTSSSQSLSVYAVDASNFPYIKAKFFAFDETVNQMYNLSPSDFTLTENGIPRKVINITCPNPKPPVALSSVLVMDISGSMGEGPPRIESAKNAAYAWINGLPLGKSDCALVSFSGNSFIVHDFTTNKKLLQDDIAQFGPTDGTNYDQALLDPPCGGLQVAKLGKHKRVIIFLSDGLPNFEPKTAEIIEFAKQNEITIFAVTLDMPAPQCLKDMAAQTGGAYFENITSQKEAEDTYIKLLKLAQGNDPCEIEWESGASCQEGITNVDLKLDSLNLFANTSYASPSSSIAKLEFSPNYIVFKNSEIGIKNTKIVKITAKNADFVISNIISSNSAFTISPSKFNLLKDQSRDLSISYLAVDSGYTFTVFNFESDLCSAKIYASGGFYNKKPTVPTLKLIEPNGGEEYLIGNNYVINWSGITEVDTVKLEYSRNNGLSWELLTNQATKFKYEWKEILRPESKFCKVRATQITTRPEQLKYGSLLMTLNHGSVINNAEWSPDGSRIATATNFPPSRIWDATTGLVIRSLIGHKSNIRNVSWSCDGSRIATASDDKTAIIYDTTKGKIIHTLSGHTAEVLDLDWSPNDNRLATSSSDKTIIIWDAINGNIIQRLTGHSSLIYRVRWSPDGTLIVSTSQDHTAIIWDALTGAKLHTLEGHNNIVVDVGWSPDSKYIATASWDYNAIIWDAQSGKQVSKLSGHKEIIPHINWSPDGKRIATASYDGTAIIWDVATGSKIHSLIGHKDKVMDVSWSPDGSSVVTGSCDHTAIIWDATSGIKVDTLICNAGFIYHVSWSPDGNRIVTTDDVNISKIWYVGDPYNEIQQDESDSVFSIVAPQASAKDIDLKKCLLGTSKDSLIHDFISNTGLYKLRVDSIYFTGTDAKAFYLISGKAKYELVPGESKTSEINFTPNRIGIHTATINIITQSDTLKIGIQGEGVEPQLEIISKFLDFGRVELGSEKIFQDTALIKNVSNYPFKINNVVQLGPDKRQFEIISGGGSFTLQPNELRRLTLRFKPIYGGRTSGQLGFEFTGAGSPAVVQLFGTGIGGLVYIMNDSAYAGDIRRLKLIMSNIKPEGIASIAPNFEAKIRYKNSILTPLKKTDRIAVNDSICMNITGTFGSSFELAQIPVIAGLGNEEETSIDILDFILKDDLGNKVDFDIEKQSGTFKLLGICREGGTRLFNSMGKVEIMQINPNPASDDIKINFYLIEEGATTLSVLNSNGVKIKEYNITGDTGLNTINLDVSEFSNGLYFIQLQTPTIVENKKLMIIK